MGGRAGQGADAAAAAFVKGKEDGPAFLAAFRPDGTHLGHTSMYGDKDEVFEFLRDALVANPDLNVHAPDERILLAAAGEAPRNDKVDLSVGRLYEELGEYRIAREWYRKVFNRSEVGSKHRNAVVHAELRMARYARNWDMHRNWLPSSKDTPVAALEHAYQHVGRRAYARARKDLIAAIKAHPECAEIAEMHFLAGVCAWFLHEKDWAHFHWVWVVKNRPDDRFYRRCYTAAAADGMPYENPELGGYRASGPYGSHDRIAQALREATADYEEKRYGFFGLERPDDPLAKSDAGKLVKQLRDGNPHRIANNEIVDQLVALGEAAVEPLIHAVKDESFAGRGYAGWALGKVQQGLGKRHEEAVKAMEATVASTGGYVRALTESGLRQVPP